ncbi:MAG: hypothetical protein QM755_06865 [Luteolibacter sp.]
MAQVLSVDLIVPSDMQRFRLPAALSRRLQSLLDKQDGGTPLTSAERKEAEGLVEMAEMLSLLRLRAEAAAKRQQA